MRKFILVISTICIFALLVALNYLLWDSTNMENEINALLTYKESSNLNVELLQSENLEIKNENARFQSTITNYTVRLQNYENTIEKMEEELELANARIGERDIMVDFLKKIMNTKIYTDVIDEWVTSINEKEYNKAYQHQKLRDAFDTKEIIGLEKFKSFFSNIERLDLKSTEINLSDMKRISNQEIAYTAIIHVTKKTQEESNTSNTIMYEGPNRVVIVFKYNEQNDDWYIYQMTFYKYNITDS
ncbi:MAG TPA: hypothetical protein DDZ89_14670 [Clostridiales bacterium]|nr:hypothetical protein [Clostridiales bacterium]